MNNRYRNFTHAKLQRRVEEIESSTQRYLTALDTADRQGPAAAKATIERLYEKISALNARMKELQKIGIKLRASPDQQVSLTDSDARSMKTRGTDIVGYNVQTAVETTHQLIVAHNAPNDGIDRDQLTAMATKARNAM